MITQENGLNIIHLPHNEYDTITDRISLSENTLVVCDNGEAEFYGEEYIRDRLRPIFGYTINESGSLYFPQRYKNSQVIINSINSIIK